MVTIALAAAAVLAPACATVTWVTRVDGLTIFGLEVANTRAGPTATWLLPEHFAFDGDRFSDVAGPMVRRPASGAQLVAGNLTFSFPDPRPGSTPDIFRLHCSKPGHLAVTYANAQSGPFNFVPATKAVRLGPWEAGRIYEWMPERPTNAEMTAIFDADQADRRSEAIDWTVVGARDAARMKRTQALLDAGALASGDDFYHAAFIFQHGDAADDYLKAHLLAMIATARGKPRAAWIASATLDRYLQAIGRPQVLGTQFKLPASGETTQEPYARDLVSDAMRQALRVPTIAEQETRRQELTAGMAKRKAP